MKLPYKWLKQYVDLPIEADELAKRFTLAGLEVEAVEEFAGGISGVLVAKVIEVKPHPASDHISICSVDSGCAIHTVLCGAANVAAGQIVPLAKIGARLPGGVEISAKTALGMVSEGMICSLAELGIDSNNRDGIWVLPEGLAIGEDILTALDLQDSVLDIALTPNRSDCLGLLNCAYEAAALAGGQVREPSLAYEEIGPPIQELLSIEVQDATLCPRYVGRLVQGVKVGPAPLWIQQCLLRAGMRPINNVVDISNYVMLERNQPLHTFDYQKLARQRIIVRAAKPGEAMRTLDGKERNFSGGEILICDGEKPICVGGIMGGFETEVSHDTVDVLIESAYFKPHSIRHTARALGLASEASQRFEKGIDISACDKAAQRAAQLLVEYCGATAARGLLDVGGQRDYPPCRIKLQLNQVNDLLGTSYNMETILQVMRSLSFAVEVIDFESAIIDIPSYRQDITLAEDLIEEIARLVGYDSIPVTMPYANVAGCLTVEQRLREKLRDISVGLGLYETVNYSFINKEEAIKLLTDKDHPFRQPLAIANPLSEEQSVMRLSLLPGLLNCAQRNISRRNLHPAIFELGAVYIPHEQRPSSGQPREAAAWGLLLSGSTAASWQKAGKAYDYFYAKGLIETIAQAFHIGSLCFERAPADLYPYLHPGRSAIILLNDEELGFLGELNPRVADNYNLPAATIVGQLWLQPLFKASARVTAAALPKYPAMERDIALVGSSQIPASQIEAAIRSAAGSLLEELKLFDTYTGPPILKGQRSLAYTLTFRHSQRTLTDAEADASIQNIVNILDEGYGLKLR